MNNNQNITIEKVKNYIENTYKAIFNKQPKIEVDIENKTDFFVNLPFESVCLFCVLEGDIYNYYPQFIVSHSGNFNPLRGTGEAPSEDYIDIECKQTESYKQATMDLYKKMIEINIMDIETAEYEKTMEF